MDNTLFLKVIDVTIARDIRLKPDDQHAELRWWPLTRLLASANVHANTKAYFSRIRPHPQ